MSKVPVIGGGLAAIVKGVKGGLVFFLKGLATGLREVRKRSRAISTVWWRLLMALSLSRMSWTPAALDG